jgi:hypothetical protein
MLTALRMAGITVGAVGLACLTSSLAAAADRHQAAPQPAPGGQAASSSFAVPKGQNDPFRKLFAPASPERSPLTRAPQFPQVAPSSQLAALPKPQVVCGLLVIPADPKVDPGFKVAAPDPRGFTMRLIQPSECQPK